MTIYRISEAGGCSRALSAQRLGYEPTKRTESDEQSLNYYSALEAVAGQQMMNEGYRIEDGGRCVRCTDDRQGIHVEIDTVLFKLVGHMDRRLLLNNGMRVPVEIKCLGRFTWQKWVNNPFGIYPTYSGQMALYLHAEQKPGIYWVLNRDTGEVARYIVNDDKGYMTSETLLHYEEFRKVQLPITYERVIENLNTVEINALDNALVEREVEGDCARWCSFKYLCTKDIEPERSNDKAIEETNLSLIEAAKLYKDSQVIKDEAEVDMDHARDVLIGHCKDNSVPKYHVQGLSVSYRGQTCKVSFDSGKLKTDKPEIYNLYLKKGRPYDDCTIRVLKGKED